MEAANNTDWPPKSHILKNNDYKNVEEYLRKNAVIDGQGCDMDGSWVPLSVAHIACGLVKTGQLKLEKPSWIT